MVRAPRPFAAAAVLTALLLTASACGSESTKTFGTGPGGALIEYPRIQVVTRNTGYAAARIKAEDSAELPTASLPGTTGGSIRWTNDTGRSDAWIGGVVDGSAPSPAAVNRRGPAMP